MKVERTVKMSKCYKATLIVFGVLEIILGLSSIAACIATIIFTQFTFWDCYYQWRYDSHNYHDDCYYFATFGKYGLYVFSNTAQGFWGGVFVIIGSSFTIHFASNPSRKIGSCGVAFSTLAFCISCTMVVLECFAVLSPWYGSGHYDWTIWMLHVVLLSFASALVVFTFISTILASVAHGCCCRKIRVGHSSSQNQIPMAISQQQVHGRYGMLPGYQNVHAEQALQREAMLQQSQLVATNPMGFQNKQTFVSRRAVPFEHKREINYAAPPQRVGDQYGIDGQSSGNAQQLTAAMLRHPQLVATNPEGFQNQQTFAPPHAVQRSNTIHYGAQNGGGQPSHDTALQNQEGFLPPIQRERTIHYGALSSQHGGGQPSRNTEKLTAAQVVTNPTAIQNQETFASPHIQRESTIHYVALSSQDGGGQPSRNTEELAAAQPVVTDSRALQNQETFASPHMQREGTIHYGAISSQDGGGQPSRDTEELTAAQLDVTDPTALQNQEIFASPHLQRESTVHFGEPLPQDGGWVSSGNAENLMTEC